MKFICDQDWEAMQVTAKGRYCDICRKEVMDYTTMSVNDIPVNQDLCGRFRIEQIDSSIIKPVQAPKQIKTFGFMSALLMSIFSKTSFAQTSTSATRTEQIHNNTNTPDTLLETKVKDPVTKEVIFETKKSSGALFLTTNKKFYYWTKKFPFIVAKKKRRPMGKF